MNFLKSFSTYIKENLKIDGQKIVWDSNSDYGIIRSRFGKFKDATPYNTNFKLINGKTLRVTSLFGRNDITSTEFIKAIKGKSNIFSLTPDAQEHLYNRSAVYLARTLREIGNIDCVITLQSSSDFNASILNKAMTKYIGNVATYHNGIIKNVNAQEIVIDPLSIDKFNDKTISSLNKQINKWKDSGYVEIKHIIPQFRKIIRNWLKVKPEIQPKLKDQTIILFDDLLTTGSSLIEAAQQCYDFGAKEVHAITFLGK